MKKNVFSSRNVRFAHFPIFKCILQFNLQNIFQSKSVFICFDVLKTEIQNTGGDSIITPAQGGVSSTMLQPVFEQQPYGFSETKCPSQKTIFFAIIFL